MFSIRHLYIMHFQFAQLHPGNPPLLLSYLETAVNIGYSCKMLTDDMTEVFIISGHTVQSVRQELRSVCQDVDLLCLQLNLCSDHCANIQICN